MVAALLLATHSPGSQSLSLFDPASPPADSIRNLTYLIFAVAGMIFLIVEGVLIYSIIRFRRRSGDSSHEPPQVYGSKPIEVAWTAAPALIVVVLTLVITRTLWEVSPGPPTPKQGDRTLFVTVIGRQWWWELRYDYYDGVALDFTTANEMHIPVGDEGQERPVYLSIKSVDVCHSFWVPRLAGKMDAIPGRTNTLWFQTDQPGLYLGQCAEYCGAQHAGMLIRVEAEAPAAFDQWMANEKKDGVRDPKQEAGASAFLKQSCVNCHTIRGTPAAGTFGPDLTHLMSRKTLASGILSNTREKLDQWIGNPQSIKSGCLMPSFGLNSRDREGIVNYLFGLE